MSIYRNIRRTLRILSLVILVGGCASKRPHATPQPFLPAGEPPATMANPAAPEDPTLQLPNAISVNPQPGEEVRHDVPRVALVLGGAGVSSFATVGLLKRFRAEGVRIDFIVATGWPALFALSYGYMRSVHDLEWFSMRLEDKDFESVAGLERGTNLDEYSKVSSLIRDTLRRRDLNETRLPVYLVSGVSDVGDSGVFDRGEWKIPLISTMSVPGIYHPFPENGVTSDSLEALGVEEALRRHADVVIAVNMYSDYLQALVSEPKLDSNQLTARKAYAHSLEESSKHQLTRAQISGRIKLGKGPRAFTAKRSAILFGYQEGARLAKELRLVLGH